MFVPDCKFFFVLDGDVSLTFNNCVDVSQLVRYARFCSRVLDFNEHNLCITEALSNFGFRFQKLTKTFT